MADSTPGTSSERTSNGAVQTLRALFHLASVVTIVWWALVEWGLPWPGILAGAGFLVLTVIVWALFLSPRPMLRTDRFGQALIELLLIAGAVAALLGLGVFWLFAALFGLAAAVLGYVASVRR